MRRAERNWDNPKTKFIMKSPYIWERRQRIGRPNIRRGLSGFCSSDSSAGVASVEAFTGRCHDPARRSWMEDTPAGEPCFGEHEIYSSFVDIFFFPVNIITSRRGFPSAVL